MERISSGNISFFFGAGASAPFGNPTMTKMTTDFKKDLTANGSTDEQNLYDEITLHLQEELGDFDIETIFTVINGLQGYWPEEIGAVALYASKKVFGNSLQDKAFIDNIENISETICKLRDRFQSFIRSSCGLRKTELVRPVYAHFFNMIAERLDRWSESPISKVKFDPGWTMFTTNYDRYLEFFWGKDGEQINLDLGFDQTENFGDPFLRHAGKLRLVKLHGSIYWLKNKDTGEVIYKEYDIDQAKKVIGVGSIYDKEMVIYPVSQKQLYVYPYLQMF